MSPKQKRAFAVLILAALAGGLAAFAPGVKCELPDESVVEDLIPDEPGSAHAPGMGPDQGESTDAGSSGPESSSSSGGV